MADMSRLEKSFEVVQTIGLAVLAFLGGRSHSPTPAHSGAGKVDESLKANLFGLGPKDEAFFWDALAIGKEKAVIDDQGIENLTKMFDDLTRPERYKLGRIVGIDEQEVKGKTTTLEKLPDGLPALDRQGKALFSTKEESFRGNVRGMRFLVMLSKMEPKKAVKFLRVSGTLEGLTEDIEATWKRIRKFIRSKEAKKFFAEFRASAGMLKNTAVKLGKDADVRTQETILRYLGAADHNEAERIVTGREEEVARRRAQSWYQRDLKNRPRLLTAWGIMGIVVVIAIIMFAVKGGPTN